MLTKKGVNNTREEKHVSGVSKQPAPDRKASLGGRTVTKRAVTCSKCGGKFEKACSADYLCEVMNTKCPKCGGDLS
jgi:hypothetical protein